MDSIERLTKLQNAVGYKHGVVNPIALLGLYGEAGEIMGETFFTSTISRPEEVRIAAVDFAHVVDTLKKMIRDDKDKKVPVSVNIPLDREAAFDVEVADALYYLNAIAIGRGKKLADYADISYQKVSNKTQINIEHTDSHVFASLPPTESMIQTSDNLGLKNPGIFIPLGPKES